MPNRSNNLQQTQPRAAVPHPQFHVEVIRPLRRVGRLLKRNLLVEGLACCAAILLLLIVLHLGLDMMLVLGVGPRAALLAFVLGCLAYQAWHRLIRPAAIRVTPEDVAALLEHRDRGAQPPLGAQPPSAVGYIGLRDVLISAVSFAQSPAAAPQPARSPSEAPAATDSPSMIAAVINDAQSRFSRVQPESILDVRRHRRFAGLGLGVVAVAIACAAISPDLVATYIARDWLLQDAAWPSRTRILLEGLVRNKILWPLGDEFTVVAIAEGEVPPTLRAEFRASNGAASVRDMALRGENQFILDYGPLTASMKVRFLVGRFGVDEPTIWYDVEAVERPRIEQAAVTVTPPSYAASPSMTLPTGQTTAEVLRGSTIAITATVNKPVTSAVLRSAGKSIIDAVRDPQPRAAVPHMRDPDRRIRAEFTPTLGSAYYFDLTDAGGLTDLHPVTFAIRLTADPPPKVRLALPGTGEMVVPGAILQLEAECEDNLALKSAELLYHVAHVDEAKPARSASDGAQPPSAVEHSGDAATPTTQPDAVTEALPGFEPRMAKFTTKHAWPLSALALKPSDQLTLAVRAADYQSVNEPRTGSVGVPPASSSGEHPRPAAVAESMSFTLKVVSPEDLLAELGRRESEWRREFEQILKSQEQIKKRALDIHDQAQSRGMSTTAAAEYGREETAQRSQIGRIKTIRRQFEQIFAELRVNQLDNPSVRKRLEGGVILPLGRLANTDCTRVADQMAQLRRQYDKKLAEVIERGQSALIEDMNAILASMLKWEGYNEAVSLLRDAIRLQSDVNRQTQSRLEEQVEDLFGDQATSKPDEK